VPEAGDCFPLCSAMLPDFCTALHSAKSKKADKATSALGMGMMVVYLLFDGFTSTWQERLFKKTKVSTWNQEPQPPPARSVPASRVRRARTLHRAADRLTRSAAQMLYVGLLSALATGVGQMGAPVVPQACRGVGVRGAGLHGPYGACVPAVLPHAVAAAAYAARSRAGACVER
jgi:hypothetical protein